MLEGGRARDEGVHRHGTAFFFPPVPRFTDDAFTVELADGMVASQQRDQLAHERGPKDVVASHRPTGVASYEFRLVAARPCAVRGAVAGSESTR